MEGYRSWLAAQISAAQAATTSQREGVPGSEALESEALESETVPSEPVASEALPSEAVPSEAVPSESDGSQDLPFEALP